MEKMGQRGNIREIFSIPACKNQYIIYSNSILRKKNKDEVRMNIMGVTNNSLFAGSPEYSFYVLRQASKQASSYYLITACFQ